MPVPILAGRHSLGHHLGDGLDRQNGEHRELMPCWSGSSVGVRDSNTKVERSPIISRWTRARKCGCAAHVPTKVSAMGVLPYCLVGQDAC
jgi:hypothetical protein